MWTYFQVLCFIRLHTVEFYKSYNNVLIKVCISLEPGYFCFIFPLFENFFGVVYIQKVIIGWKKYFDNNLSIYEIYLYVYLVASFTEWKREKEMWNNVGQGIMNSDNYISPNIAKIK